MSHVEWSEAAASDLEAYLDRIDEHAPSVVARLRREIAARTKLLAERPMIGNPSRWRGFRVHGKPKLHKFVVYSVTDSGIRIAAFRDARQDNTSLRLANS